MVACNKVKPSTKLTKAVSNHCFKNVSNFKTNIIDLVTQKVCMILIFAIHGHRKMLWILYILDTNVSSFSCHN